MSQQELSGSTRVRSVDILRGAVMVLMAIDHVRVYSGLPAGGPDVGIFLTRWITHFCAPAFVFLAGTSAFLNGRKTGDTNALARYLVTRGLLLVVLELTLIRFGWTFNLNYSEFTLAGVIWMLGWCMVLLALFVKLRPAMIGTIGLVIIFLQQLFSFVPNLLPASLHGFWEFIYSSGKDPLPGVTILYVLVPWIGVMMAGYGFGALLLQEPAKSSTRCKQIGLSAILVFLIIGSVLILARPATPEDPAFLFQLLNQQKYPASQLFLLMTLGPAIALMPLAEKSFGRLAEALTIFGRVPFFYYLLHIPLIHVTALLVNLLRDGAIHQEWYATAPFVYVADEPLRWNLPLLYVVLAVDVVILYAACKWFMGYKHHHPEKKWLKYL